jgi:uncharacterized zinc-type alcohol dehydrogenase-like protein
MSQTKAYAAKSATSDLGPITIERRAPGPHDVAIDIAFCGVCHSDVHSARNEWGGTRYPIVPGHEIVGTVTAVGSEVSRWKVGQQVGVGCMVNSCRTCASCIEHEEQFCENGMTGTYNSVDRYGDGTVTNGGYSTGITVNEDFVLRIPEGMPLDRTAPLLCAGITTYSPLHRFGVKAGDKVGIVGLGGLGHMGVKIAKAMGAHVTMISHSASKQADAERLGADDFLLSKDADAFKKNAKRFDFILDTVSAPHDYNAYLGMLRRGGTMVLGRHARCIANPCRVFGAPTPSTGRLTYWWHQGNPGNAGFLRQAQGAKRHELIPMDQINTAYERMLKSDVRYRFVIDMKSLGVGGIIRSPSLFSQRSSSRRPQ